MDCATDNLHPGVESNKFIANTLVKYIETIYNKIAEINFLLLEYDCIYVEQPFYDSMKSIFSNIQLSINNGIKIINLNDFVISPDLLILFHFDPIKTVL